MSSPNQWSKTPPAPSSYAVSAPVQSGYSSSALPSNQFTPVTGSTRYSLYNDPLVGYSQIFPYNGAFVAVTSQYQNSGAPATSNWSTQ